MLLLKEVKVKSYKERLQDFRNSEDSICGYGRGKILYDVLEKRVKLII